MVPDRDTMVEALATHLEARGLVSAGRTLEAMDDAEVRRMYLTLPGMAGAEPEPPVVPVPVPEVPQPARRGPGRPRNSDAAPGSVTALKMELRTARTRAAAAARSAKTAEGAEASWTEKAALATARAEKAAANAAAYRKDEAEALAAAEAAEAALGAALAAEEPKSPKAKPAGGGYVPWKQADAEERQRRILASWDHAITANEERDAATAALAAAIEARAGIPERDPGDVRWRFAAATGGTTLAIDEEGFLWARGSNRGGTCGVGDIREHEAFIQVDTARWTKAYSHLGTSCGLREDGTLWVWGDHAYGPLPVEGAARPCQTVPLRVGTDADWADLSMTTKAGSTLVAVKSDGTLWRWGYLPGNDGPGGASSVSSFAAPVRFGEDSDWASVASGNDFTFALKRDGSLWAWGQSYGSSGVLCQGNKQRLLVPMRVGTDTDWDKVVPGYNFALARKSDGSLWGWGDNSWWQLGLGGDDSNDRPRRKPTRIDVGKRRFSDVAAGDQMAIAIGTDGTLWTWGHTPSEAHWRTIERVSSPGQYDGEEGTDWVSAQAGCHAIRADGTLWDCPPNLFDDMKPERVG